MKNFLPTGFCFLLGFSLATGCGGGSGASGIAPGLPNQPPLITISACSGGDCASPAALPVGTVGGRYGYRIYCYGDLREHCDYGVLLQAQGGVAPYTTWSISGLPPGLILGRFCNLSGCSFPTIREVYGTPTMAGTYNIVVTVADSESPPAQGSANYTITINQPKAESR